MCFFGGCGRNILNSRSDLSDQNIEFIVVDDDNLMTMESNAKRYDSTDALLKEHQFPGSGPVFLVGAAGGTNFRELIALARKLRSSAHRAFALAIRPFDMEGHDKMSLAEENLNALKQTVDEVNILNNQKYLDNAEKGTNFAQILGSINNDIWQYIQDRSGPGNDL